VRGDSRVKAVHITDERSLRSPKIGLFVIAEMLQNLSREREREREGERERERERERGRERER
jgi:hypothetical protein